MIAHGYRLVALRLGKTYSLGMTKSFRCRDCSRSPAQTAFARDGKPGGGHRTLCLDCSRARRAAAAAAFTGGRADGEKACLKCGAVKPRLGFQDHVLGADGRHSWCRSCVTSGSNAYVKARRAADPRLAERDAQRAARAALKADHRAHVDARQRHLANCSAHVQAWRDWKAAQPPAPRTTPPQVAVYERAKSAFRRARRLGRLAPWCSIRDTLQFYERAAELERLTGVDWNVDHRVPLRATLASGLHCPANLQVLPRAVNEGKANFFSLEHA